MYATVLHVFRVRLHEVEIEATNMSHRVIVHVFRGFVVASDSAAFNFAFCGAVDIITL